MDTILVVDDEEDLLDLLEFNLSNEGYDIICCADTKNVKSILKEEKVSLILMDRNLPDIEGSVFVQSLKSDGFNIPVIYLSAKDSDDDILEGFDRGGDDYITKPFNLDILKARIKAVLKREKKEFEKLQVLDIIYIAKVKKFFIDEKEIKLTKLEHDLLLSFIKNKDILLTREYLIDNIWQNSEIEQKTVNVAIKRLKEKIDPNNKKNYIKAIRGEGYIFG